MKVKIAVGTIGLAAIGTLFFTLSAQPAPRMQPRLNQGQSSSLSTPSDQPPQSVWDGVYTEEQAERGRPLYNKQCASCHGETLSGGDEVPALAGSQFLGNWNGLTVGDLFERIRLSMPQSSPGKLSRQVYADILAYMLKVNQFPAGKIELSRDTEFLKQIRIESNGPDPGPGQGSDQGNGK